MDLHCNNYGVFRPLLAIYKGYVGICIDENFLHFYKTQNIPKLTFELRYSVIRKVILEVLVDS